MIKAACVGIPGVDRYVDNLALQNSPVPLVIATTGRISYDSDMI